MQEGSKERRKETGWCLEGSVCEGIEVTLLPEIVDAVIEDEGIFLSADFCFAVKYEEYSSTNGRGKWEVLRRECFYQLGFN